MLVSATACGSQSSPAARPADALADVASAVGGGPIVCGTDGVYSAPTKIRARGDGVHLRFRNTWEKELLYRLVLADGSREGGSIPPGRSSVVVLAPPGELLVTCTTDPSWHGPSAFVEIVDPLGHSVGARLSCSGGTGVSPLYDGVSEGDKDLIAATKRLFAHGLRDGDVVRELDYVHDGERAVIVERANRVLARADFIPTGRGGWVAGGLASCGDF